MRTGEAKGRSVIVTGAGHGIGAAIARHLAARGNRVGLLDLQGDAARGAARELHENGVTAVGVAVDVTDRAAIDAALAEVRAQLGPITTTDASVWSTGRPVRGSIVCE